MEYSDISAVCIEDTLYIENILEYRNLALQKGEIFCIKQLKIFRLSSVTSNHKEYINSGHI